jgi:hypothetical protein
MAPIFIQKWHSKVANNPEAMNALPQVACFPMRSLLYILGLKHVDIWILDVEGAEESVLRSTGL